MAKSNQIHQALSRLLDAIRDSLTPEAAEALVNLRADQSTQDLLDELAERHHESQLTPEELSEYESLVAAVELVSVLQAKARSVLKSRKAS